jgi:NAD(P)-dependent dehydrogenase (short-subunit alcohol dehydrogenase family)
MDIFKDKVATVTGGGSGIGKALCERLARLGAKVVLSDINPKSAEKVGAAIRNAGGKAVVHTLDVTDYNAFKKHIHDTVEVHGKLDYIFNNAGIAIGAEFRDMELEHWQQVINVNLNGVFHGSLLAYKQMVKQGYGHIINLSSVEGMVPFPTTGSYVASKYAVLGLSQTLWVEGHSLGVKVSAVCPGFIKTPIYDVSPMVNIDREKILSQYKTFQKLGITPKKCALVILKGVAKNKPIIPVTGLAHVIWRLARVAPVAYMKYVRKDFDKWRNSIRM